MGRSMRKSGFFDPDTLTLLYRAFDETWQQIARNDQTPEMIEDRRDRLASIILALADEGVRDVTHLKERATHLMVLAAEPKRLNGHRANP